MDQTMAKSHEIDILVHISAKVIRKDDDRYRAQAVAYMNFEKSRKSRKTDSKYCPLQGYNRAIRGENSRSHDLLGKSMPDAEHNGSQLSSDGLCKVQVADTPKVTSAIIPQSSNRIHSNVENCNPIQTPANPRNALEQLEVIQQTWQSNQKTTRNASNTRKRRSSSSSFFTPSKRIAYIEDTQLAIAALESQVCLPTQSTLSSQLRNRPHPRQNQPSCNSFIYSGFPIVSPTQDRSVPSSSARSRLQQVVSTLTRVFPSTQRNSKAYDSHIADPKKVNPSQQTTQLNKPMGSASRDQHLRPIGQVSAVLGVHPRSADIESTTIMQPGSVLDGGRTTSVSIKWIQNDLHRKVLTQTNGSQKGSQHPQSGNHEAMPHTESVLSPNDPDHSRPDALTSHALLDSFGNSFKKKSKNTDDSFHQQPSSSTCCEIWNLRTSVPSPRMHQEKVAGVETIDTYSCDPPCHNTGIQDTQSDITEETAVSERRSEQELDNSIFEDQDQSSINSITKVDPEPQNSSNDPTDFTTIPQWVIPPPPAVGERRPSRDSILSPSLRQLLLDPQCKGRYNPETVQRDLKWFDRGYWYVDTSSWNSQLQMEFWQGMAEFIRRGHAGWSLWISRGNFEAPPPQNELGEVHVWCHAYLIEHVYVLMWVMSSSKIVHVRAEWRIADGTAIVSMPLG
jgi:hypothetical protein